MSELDDILEGVRRQLAPDYADLLRAALRQRDKAWLVDELVRLIVERDLGVDHRLTSRIQTSSTKSSSAAS